MARLRILATLAAALPAAALPLVSSLGLGCAVDPSLDDDQADGAISVKTRTVTVFRDYEIDQPAQDNQFTTRFRTQDEQGDRIVRHAYHLKLLEVRNGAGLALSFVVGGSVSAPDTSGDGVELCGPTSCAGQGRAPYGARLYRADLTTSGGRVRPLLYTNGDGRISPNWGPQKLDGSGTLGWLGLGGAEAAFPVEEHGFYSATAWDYAWQRNTDGSVSFTSSTTGDPGGDGHQSLAVAVGYTVPVQAPYWKNRISITNPSTSAAHEFQYWHNYMMPAGTGDDRHRIEVLLPDVSRIQVHSTGDNDLKRHNTDEADLPGILEDGGHAHRVWRKGGKESLIHGRKDSGTVNQWLGLFSLDGAVERYGFYDHDAGHGLGIHAAPSGNEIPAANLIFPKAFGGPGIGTDNWTADSSRYVEMWYSVNTPDFWTQRSLAPGSTQVNETLVFPFLDQASFDGFDPFAPDGYRVESDTPVDPDPQPTTAALGAWQSWQERNQSSIQIDAEGHGVVRIVGSGGDGFNGGAFSRVCGLAGATLGVTATVSDASSQWTEVIALTDGRAPQNGADVTGSQTAAAGIALGGAEQVVTPSGDCVTLVVKAGTTHGGATEGATFRLAVRKR